MAGLTGDGTTARSLACDADPTVRATALAALDRLGQLGDDEVEAALADGSAVVRRRAAALAAWRPAVGLAVALDDPEPLVVETAAWACGERSATDAATFEALVAAAGDHPDPRCREAAVAALGAIGDARALDVILAATRDRPAVRRRAVSALAPFAGPEVDAALARARQDRDWQVRQAAEDLS